MGAGRPALSPTCGLLAHRRPLVVNDAATLPAALTARRAGGRGRVPLSRGSGRTAGSSSRARAPSWRARFLHCRAVAERLSSGRTVARGDSGGAAGTAGRGGGLHARWGRPSLPDVATRPIDCIRRCSRRRLGAMPSRAAIPPYVSRASSSGGARDLTLHPARQPGDESRRTTSVAAPPAPRPCDERGGRGRWSSRTTSCGRRGAAATMACAAGAGANRLASRRRRVGPWTAADRFHEPRASHGRAGAIARPHLELATRRRSTAATSVTFRRRPPAPSAPGSAGPRRRREASPVSSVDARPAEGTMKDRDAPKWGVYSYIAAVT